MESSARRRSKGIKGKLVMSFYKAPKPSATTQYSSKVKINAPASTASMGYVVDDILVPPVPMPPMKEKVKMLRAHVEAGRDSAGWYADGDENVDTMAANYISRMQERFRLEQND